jgi:hypothetical protein
MGDGKRYKMNLRTADTFDGVNYQAEFQPQAGQWIEARVPLSAFVPNFRGRPFPGAPPLNPALVRQVGLMIAGWQGRSIQTLRATHLSLLSVARIDSCAGQQGSFERLKKDWERSIRCFGVADKSRPTAAIDAT